MTIKAFYNNIAYQTKPSESDLKSGESLISIGHKIYYKQLLSSKWQCNWNKVEIHQDHAVNNQSYFKMTPFLLRHKELLSKLTMEFGFFAAGETTPIKLPPWNKSKKVSVWYGRNGVTYVPDLTLTIEYSDGFIVITQNVLPRGASLFIVINGG